jgi:FixJ family two-component response regulator
MNQMSEPIIHVVDDDVSFLTAVGALLNAHGYRTSLHTSATDLLETPPQDELACILLDVQMADLSGPQLQQRLAGLSCKLPIVFVTGHGDISTTVQTMKAGAEDFLTKPIRGEQLLAAVQRAIERHRRVRELESRTAALHALITMLTPRERAVFELLVRGKVHKQIAYELGISERTVKMHRRGVLLKLQVRSLAELAVIAERLGLLSYAEMAPAQGVNGLATSHPDRRM